MCAAMTSGRDHSEDAVILELQCSADPDRRLRLAAFELEEKLGAPYLGTATVVSEVDWSGPLVAPADLLGADVTLSVARGGSARDFRGLVRRVETIGTTSTHQTFRLEVVPALALLAQQVDSRIFWELSVVEVLDAVLGAGLAPYDRELRISNGIDRPSREYCVQYQESDLDFAHRLMEEEGLTYYFDHEGERETLVVVERNEDFPGARDHLDFLMISDGSSSESTTDVIADFADGHRLTPTTLSLTDFDWKRAPSKPISVALDDAPDALGRSRPVYDHGRALDLGTFASGSGTHDGDRQARLRSELLKRDALVASGRGTALVLRSGAVFSTADKRDLSVFDGKTWLAVSVRHRAHDPRFRAVTGIGDAEIPYANAFDCLPYETPYRPSRRTPKPRIYGMQTAIVVGPQGAPIHSDEHRRVRVRFHWDRYRPNDTLETQDHDRHSCWVRVSQSWAGFGYGTLFLPRVGMEVVVSFLDGDPDRPLVVGCVYNAENPPPYQSTDEWTVSAIRTLTVDGSDLGPGYNELRFEDAKGKEQVFVHAERDLDEVVEHDHSTRVKSCQSNVVDVDQRERVGRDQQLTVERNRKKRVEGGERNVVVGNRFTKVKSNDDSVVNGNQWLRVHQQRHLEITGEETENFHGGRTCAVKAHDVLSVLGGADRNVFVTGEHNIKADGRFHVENGAQMIHMQRQRIHIESDGSIVLERPGSEVRIQSDGIQIRTSGSLFLHGGGCTLGMHEGRVLITAEDEAKMRTSGGEVKVGTTYAAVHAQNVDIAADSVAAVTGGTLVRIN
jgi:type VI secretion system secreted protein VgrG